jgi:hypothetical protein
MTRLAVMWPAPIPCAATDRGVLCTPWARPGPEILEGLEPHEAPDTGVELALLEMLEHGPAQRAVTTHGVQTEG